MEARIEGGTENSLALEPGQTGTYLLTPAFSVARTQNWHEALVGIKRAGDFIKGKVEMEREGVEEQGCNFVTLVSPRTLSDKARC